MSSYISQFNNQLKEFLEDLKLLDLEDINKIENNMYYLKLNSKIAINFFRKFISENEINRYMIFEQNDFFFINQNYNNEIENVSQLMVNQIKKKWIQLNKDQKQKIWNYFKIFIYYSDKDLGIDTVSYNKEIKSKYLSALLYNKNNI
jgi:hypothetical protein